MNHKLRDLVGTPWTPQRNCWWLVREVVRRETGLELPVVSVKHPFDANVKAIKEAVEVLGFKRIERASLPRPGWIVLTRTVLDLHAGIVVEANGRIGVLDSSHRRGGIYWQTWADAIRGAESVELWGPRNAS